MRNPYCLDLTAEQQSIACLNRCRRLSKDNEYTTTPSETWVYIAAPAAVRIALPEANPSYYLTASLAITFPFNLTVGIPLYYALARFLFPA